MCSYYSCWFYNNYNHNNQCAPTALALACCCHNLPLWFPRIFASFSKLFYPETKKSRTKAENLPTQVGHEKYKELTTHSIPKKTSWMDVASWCCKWDWDGMDLMLNEVKSTLWLRKRLKVGVKIRPHSQKSEDANILDAASNGASQVHVLHQDHHHHCHLVIHSHRNRQDCHHLSSSQSRIFITKKSPGSKL